MPDSQSALGDTQRKRKGSEMKEDAPKRNNGSKYKPPMVVAKAKVDVDSTQYCHDSFSNERICSKTW